MQPSTEPFAEPGEMTSAEFAPLLEELAKEVHDTWMQARLAEGWKLGPERNDSRREHPNLVPFEHLPEIEKAYDRRTAQTTLRQIMQLGYRIVRPANPSVTASGQHLTAFGLARKQLGTLPPKGILALWRGREPAIWRQAPDLYRQAAERMLRAGEPLVAFDMASEGLKEWADDIRLRQLLASALIKSGAPRRASVILKKLMDGCPPDEETLGLLASSYKQLALRAADWVAGESNLRLASEFYLRAYRSFGGIWPGINAATVLFLRGDVCKKDAITIATAVRKKCEADLAGAMDHASQYWLWATLGETWLLEGKLDKAAEAYGSAVKAADERWGDVCTTARNARLILEASKGASTEDRERILGMLQGPPVALFCGLMIDPQQVRFPQSAAPRVKQAIGEALDKSGAMIGYASAACGSDLLFLEAMLERGGQIKVVLPYCREQFRSDAVSFASPEWGSRFDAVLERATDVIEASTQRLTVGAASLRYASLLLHGMAHIQAEQINARLLAIAVWDGRESFSASGVSAQIRQWQEAKLEVQVIPMAELLESAPAPQTPLPLHVDLPRLGEDGDGRIVALLFADAVHFSKLGEQQVAMFVKYFMGMVGDLARHSPHRPSLKNTWGDGLFFTFEHVRDAGMFAMELCEHISACNWTEFALPEGLNLRIGLHAGPVVYTTDPVTAAPGLYGTHISQAARIEPTTPAGEVYASRPFAALAAAEGVGEFQCEYVGQIDLAKSFGTFPMFRIQRVRGGQATR